MTIKTGELNIGDTVEYLGGDALEGHADLKVGSHYVIDGIDFDGDPYFENKSICGARYRHSIGPSQIGFAGNQQCFKKVS